jgi:hypothetical protein
MKLIFAASILFASLILSHAEMKAPQGQDQIAQLGQHAQHPRIERGEFGPVARAPPAVRQRVMAILGALAVTAIGQAANGVGQKLPATGAFALAFLGLAGDICCRLSIVRMKV